MSTEDDILCINGKIAALEERDEQLLAGINANEARLDAMDDEVPADGVVPIGPDFVIDVSLGNTFWKAITSSAAAFTFENFPEGKEIAVAIEATGTFTAVNPFDANGVIWATTPGPPDIDNTGFKCWKFKFHRINNRIYGDTQFDSYN